MHNVWTNVNISVSSFLKSAWSPSHFYSRSYSSTMNSTVDEEAVILGVPSSTVANTQANHTSVMQPSVMSPQFCPQPVGVSLSLCIAFIPSPAHGRPPPLPQKPHLHIIYTPSFENGSFLKIHLDYQTLKVTWAALSVWLGRWLQTAEQCGGRGINASLGHAAAQGRGSPLFSPSSNYF